MSRIERPRVQPDETTSATELNNTYDDYSQAGALDQSNTRDAAFDLVHFSNASILVNTQLSQLGNTGMLHTAPTSSLTQTTNLASPVKHVVQDSGGTETIMNLSSSPWTLAVGDVIRVFWDLSVSPTFSGSPWNTSGAKGRYTVPHYGGAPATIVISDGLHCWAAYLEWDVVSASLNNWSTVPGQGAFTQTYDSGADKGEAVKNTAATTLISAWTVFSLTNVLNGATADEGQGQSQGWFGTHGMWAHQATSGTTVYGIRLVLTGMLHPAHKSGASPYENLLLYDINAAGTLTYKGGRITAIQMRGD